MVTADVVAGGGGCGGGIVIGGGGVEVEDVGGAEVAGGEPDIADTRLVGARVSHLREMLRGRRRGRRKRGRWLGLPRSRQQIIVAA